MTLQITIKNEDPNGRVAEVHEETFTMGQPSPTRTDKSSLAAGESRAFHIHAAKRITVFEAPY